MPTPKKVKSLPVIIVDHHHHHDLETKSDDNLINVNSSIEKERTKENRFQEVLSTPKQLIRKNTSNAVSGVRCNSDDRFIANRKKLNSEYASFKLGPPPSPSDWMSDDVFDNATAVVQSSQQYRHRMACLSQGASEAKVLRFGSTGSLSFANGRSHSQEIFDPHLAFVKTGKTLPKEPEQILDLPDIDDNFFTNTVCWGAKNHVVAALGTSLYVTNKDRLKKVSQLTVHKDHPFTAVACSSDGSLVVAATEVGDLQVWDIEQKKLIISNEGHECQNWVRQCGVSCISWKPNSSIFVTGCRSGYLNHFDCRSGDVVITNAEQSDSMICGLEFSPSGNLLASTNTSFFLKVWDWTGTRACFSKLAHNSSCRALVWSPEKAGCLASGGGIGDGHIRIWNVYSGELLGEVDMRSQVCSLAWSPLTRDIFAGCSVPGKHTVSVLTYPELRFVGTLAGHQGRVLRMGLGPCKTLLFTASADETLRFWRIADRSTPSAPVRSTSCTFLSKLR